MKIDRKYYLFLVVCLCTLFFSATLADRRTYGEECNRTHKCNLTAWLSCRDGKCGCYKSDEMLYDEGTGKCLTKSGERCKYSADSEEIFVEITDCVPNSVCSADGVCECDSKYHETYNGTCGLSVLFGEECSEEDQCSKFVGLHCVDSKCECKDGIYSDEKGYCIGRSQSNCLRDECVDGAICVRGKCLCDSEHFHSSEKICLPKKEIFEDCDRDVECRQTDTLKLRCISGKCGCAYNFEYASVQKYEYTVHNPFRTVGGYKPFAIGFIGPFVEMCAPKIGAKCPHGYCTKNAFCDAEAQESYTGPVYGWCRCIDKDLQNCTRLYGQNCSVDTDCINDLVCFNGKCNCPSPFHQFFDYFANVCVTKIGGHCTDTSICVPHSSCVYSTPTNRSGHCRCDPNAVVNMDRYCDLVYGEECVEGNVHCDTYAGLVCINRKCSCPDTMYEYNAKFRKCLGLVGAACDNSEENIVCEPRADKNDEQPSDCHPTSQSKLVCIENAYCKDESPLMECNCADGYVETDNHTCVLEMKTLCGSGTMKCSDGSDDEYSIKAETKAQEIKYNESDCGLHTCKNGQCIRNEWVCDGIVQCDDNSDEMNCLAMTNTKSSYADVPTCDVSSQWRCRSGMCIHRSYFCDGNTNCYNDGNDGYSNRYSDEPAGCQRTNECVNAFKCRNGDCIKRHRVCDGVGDCKDGSDEAECVV